MSGSRYKSVQTAKKRCLSASAWVRSIGSDNFLNLRLTFALSLIVLLFLFFRPRIQSFPSWFFKANGLPILERYLYESRRLIVGWHFSISTRSSKQSAIDAIFFYGHEIIYSFIIIIFFSSPFAGSIFDIICCVRIDLLLEV